MIKKFHNFTNENFVNQVKSDLKKFSELRHKVIVSLNGNTFNVFYSTDRDTSLRITKLYVGKHALDLGGYAPSYNDVWLQKGISVLIIKTNKDDIVPDDVIIQAAQILRVVNKTHKEETDTVTMALSMYVKVSGQDVLVDEVNTGRVLFTTGNTKLIR